MSYSPELDDVIESVKQEFKLMLVKRQQLVQKLGCAFEKVVANPESVCEEIKSCLKEEIAEGIISSRTIEQYCLEKWKKKTRPKQENEKISFPHIVKREDKKRKISLDTRNLADEINIYNKESGRSRTTNNLFDEDDYALQEKEGTIKDSESQHRLSWNDYLELAQENKRLRDERDELLKDLANMVLIAYEQKKDQDLLKQLGNTNKQSEKSDSIFEVEFAIEYRPLQRKMQEIFNSPVRQEVWFTVIIDGIMKRVVSASIGRKSQQEEDLG